MTGQALLFFLAHRLIGFFSFPEESVSSFPPKSEGANIGEYGNQYQIHYVHKSCQIMSQSDQCRDIGDDTLVRAVVAYQLLSTASPAHRKPTPYQHGAYFTV